MIFTFIEAKPGQMPPEGWRGTIILKYQDVGPKELPGCYHDHVARYVSYGYSVLWAKDITEEVRGSLEAYKSELRSYDDYDKVKDTVERLIEINPLIQSMEMYLK